MPEADGEAPSPNEITKALAKGSTNREAAMARLFTVGHSVEEKLAAKREVEAQQQAARSSRQSYSTRLDLPLNLDNDRPSTSQAQHRTSFQQPSAYGVLYPNQLQQLASMQLQSQGVTPLTLPLAQRSPSGVQGSPWTESPASSTATAPTGLFSAHTSEPSPGSGSPAPLRAFNVGMRHSTGHMDRAVVTAAVQEAANFANGVASYAASLHMTDVVGLQHQQQHRQLVSNVSHPCWQPGSSVTGFHSRSGNFPAFAGVTSPGLRAGVMHQTRVSSGSGNLSTHHSSQDDGNANRTPFQQAMMAGGLRSSISATDPGVAAACSTHTKASVAVPRDSNLGHTTTDFGTFIKTPSRDPGFPHVTPTPLAHRRSGAPLVPSNCRSGPMRLGGSGAGSDPRLPPKPSTAAVSRLGVKTSDNDQERAAAVMSWLDNQCAPMQHPNADALSDSSLNWRRPSEPISDVSQGVRRGTAWGSVEIYIRQAPVEETQPPDAFAVVGQPGSLYEEIRASFHEHSMKRSLSFEQRVLDKVPGAWAIAGAQTTSPLPTPGYHPHSHHGYSLHGRPSAPDFTSQAYQQDPSEAQPYDLPGSAAEQANAKARARRSSTTAVEEAAKRNGTIMPHAGGNLQLPMEHSLAWTPHCRLVPAPQWDINSSR